MSPGAVSHVGGHRAGAVLPAGVHHVRAGGWGRVVVAVSAGLGRVALRAETVNAWSERGELGDCVGV